MKAVVQGERPSVSNDELKQAPDDFVVLMHECWDTDANMRPSFDELFVALTKMLQMRLKEEEARRKRERAIERRRIMDVKKERRIKRREERKKQKK